MKEGSAGALPERGDRLQDVLFGLRLDLRELLEPVVASGLLELLDGRDAEMVVDHACGRGADTWDAKEREQTRRHRRLQVGVTLRDSGRDELLDRLGDRRPDLGDLLEASFVDELRERLAQVADRARGCAVRDRTENVLALQLDEVADLVEDLRDRIVVEGQRLSGHAGMLGLVRAAPRQLEHVVGGLGLAPRAELARVLRRDRRAISVVLDLRHQTDRFAVGA